MREALVQLARFIICAIVAIIGAWFAFSMYTSARESVRLKARGAGAVTSPGPTRLAEPAADPVEIRPTFPGVCDVEAAFEANEITANRDYPEGSRLTVSLDVAAVNAGYTQPTISPTGCRDNRLPFDDVDRLAALRPGDHVVARCTFVFRHMGRMLWDDCSFGESDPPAVSWFCACVSEGSAADATAEPTVEPIDVTVCRPTRNECDRLVARAERGTGALVGVVAPCVGVEGSDRPAVEVEPGETLEPSTRSGGWQLRGRCALE